MFGVHNGGLTDLLRGLYERVYFVDYKDGKGLSVRNRVTVGGLKELLRPAYKWFRRNRVIISKISEDEFISSYSDARKRKRYEQAKASLELSRVERRDARVQSFVKAEKTNFSAKLDPAPRIISPRDPRYNLALGVYTRPLEGLLYKLMNKMFGNVVIMKGLNSREQGAAIHDAWKRYNKPVAVSLDFVKFDAATREAQLKYEQSVYKLFFAGVDLHELSRLLSWQLVNDNVAYFREAIVKFVTDIRCSGDMNTGLGTCLIACSIIYSFKTKVGVDLSLIDNGDDMAVILEADDLPKIEGLSDFCLGAGYVATMEPPAYIMEHIDFCQCRPVWDGEQYVMIRSYPTVLSKDVVSLLPLNTEDDWRKWCNDVGGCGIALNAGMPILQSFYAGLKRSGVGSFGDHPWANDMGIFRLSRGLEQETKPICDDTRVSFWEAFGVPPATQEIYEKYLDTREIGFSRDLKGYDINYLSRPTHLYYCNIFNDGE